MAIEKLTEAGMRKIGVGGADNILTGTPEANKRIFDNLPVEIGKKVNEVIDAVTSGDAQRASHMANVNNPHNVTKVQVGLGNVDNTADMDKPVSDAVRAELETKADKSELEEALKKKVDEREMWMHLSAKADDDNFRVLEAEVKEMYSNSEIDKKLASVTIPIDDALDATSENPVQNKAVAEKVAELASEIENKGESTYPKFVAEPFSSMLFWVAVRFMGKDLPLTLPKGTRIEYTESEESMTGGVYYSGVLKKDAQGFLCTVDNGIYGKAGYIQYTIGCDAFEPMCPGDISPGTEIIVTLPDYWECCPGRKTERGEIFNDYDNNRALYTNNHAEGSGTTAGFTGYKMLSVTANGTSSIDIEVRDKDLTKKASSAYAVGDKINFEAQMHWAEIATIKGFSTSTDGNTVINVTYFAQHGLDKNGTDELEDWLSVTGKEGGEPIGHYRFAHAEGEDTIAAGRSAHAEGRSTKVIGNHGHAEGRNTKAGYCAHAEGLGSVATGMYAHSEGDATQATATGAHSEGNKSKATGVYSHAEGNNTQAIGAYAHTEGSETVVKAQSGHAEGTNTFVGRMAFRLYEVVNSLTLRLNTVEGLEVGDVISHSVYDSVLEAWTSLSDCNTIATINKNNKTITLEESVYAISNEVLGGGYKYLWVNKKPEAGTEALCSSGHAEGLCTTVTGDSAHAEGYDNIASGTFAHAEGSNNTASGESSHVEGADNVASGIRSHAEGGYTVAKAVYGHSEGYYTIARGVTGQHVEGVANLEDTEGEFLHIIGNGKVVDEGGERKITRSNAHTVNKSGDGWYAGNVTVGENKDKLVTEAELATAISNAALDGADVVVDSVLSASSENPIQNKAVTAALAGKADKADVYTKTEVNAVAETFATKGELNDYWTSKEVEDRLALKADTSDVTAGLAEKADKTEVESLSDAVSALGIATPEMYGAKGDGITDDYKAIQNFLNENRLVRFTEGRTYFTSANLYIPSDTTILGYGAKICTNSNLIFTNETDNATGGYGQAKNISIYGLDLYSSVNGRCTLVGFSHCENIKIIDCTFHDIIDWHMIEFSATKNAVVENCNFYNYAIGGTGTEVIQLDCMYDEDAFPWFGPYDNTPCENIKILNCNFETTTTSTAVYKPSAIGNHSNAKCKDVIIDKCTIKGFKSGFKFNSFAGLTITNCIVNDVQSGFVAMNVETVKQRLIIKDCKFVGNMDMDNLPEEPAQDYMRGILTYQPCVDVTIEGCDISNFDGHGITPQATDVIIRGNKVHGNGGIGIYGGYKSRNEVIESNISENNHLNSNIAQKYDLQFNNLSRYADEKSLAVIKNNNVGTINVYTSGDVTECCLVAHNSYSTVNSMSKNAATIVNCNFDKTAKKMNVDNATYLDNPIASVDDDTVANWVALGSCFAYISPGHLKDQPATYGLIESMVYGGDVVQFFYCLGKAYSGNTYKRSGYTERGWDTSWVQVLDADDVTETTEE